MEKELIAFQAGIESITSEDMLAVCRELQNPTTPAFTIYDRWRESKNLEFGEDSIKLYLGQLSGAHCDNGYYNKHCYSFEVRLKTLKRKLKMPEYLRPTFCMVVDNFIEDELKRKPKINKPWNPKKYVTKVEYDEFMSKCPQEHIKYIMDIMYHHGTRINEVVGIRLDKIKPAKGSAYDIDVWNGKRSRWETITVEKSLIDEIKKTYHGKKYLFEMRQEDIDQIKNPELKAAQRVGSRWQTTAVTEAIRRMWKKINPDIPHTSHNTRPSFITDMVTRHEKKQISDYAHVTEAVMDKYYLEPYEPLTIEQLRKRDTTFRTSNNGEKRPVQGELFNPYENCIITTIPINPPIPLHLTPKEIDRRWAFPYA